MHHETALTSTLALGFSLALVFGLIAARLRLPPLVGYLLAGIAVGPFTPGLFADTEIASELAEIGVILLMFGVGMHFSLRDLFAVRKISLPGAMVQISVATVLGVLIAQLWGWSIGEGLVFGLALSVASTVVLLRALESRGLLSTVDGRVAVGWLIVEDLAMVVALVLLPALATTLGGTSPNEAASTPLAVTLLVTFVKLSAFVAVMHFLGRKIVPWLLNKVAETASRELFTLALLAAALGTAFGAAALFDVSFALAAFFAGLVISESHLSHRVAVDALPFQDAFAVLFFVSVGMLFNPSVLVDHPGRVLIVFLIIVLAKSVAAFAIVLLFKHTVRTALRIAASLAQIGEFSFILIAVGSSLELVRPEAESLILAGAILSITVNPLIFATIEPLNRWFTKHPRIAGLVERKGTTNPLPGFSTDTLRDHAVLIGHGDVGAPVAQALLNNGVEVVVVEQDHSTAQRLSDEGLVVISGDATKPGLLEHANLAHARAIVVSVGDALDARLVIEHARSVNPNIQAIVRTHSQQESVEMANLGVQHVIVAETEMTRAAVAAALELFPTGR